MNKVWIVESEWIYDGCPDDYRNCYEHNILGVFETEEAAVAYILEQLAVMLERKIEEATEHEDNLCLTELPTKEDLMLTKTIKFSDYWDTEERFKYYELPVQRGERTTKEFDIDIFYHNPYCDELYMRQRPTIIAAGNAGGHKFVIRSVNGFYPTAYLAVNKKEAELLSECSLVHGGVTYGDLIDSVYYPSTAFWDDASDKEEYIGWDYCHFGDYNRGFKDLGGKKYFTNDIFDEITEIVKWLTNHE